jgi:RimJ/RimL family protein N-acetyltransferase
MTESDAPVLTVIGERVALGPTRRELLPLYTRWRNDVEVMRQLDCPRPWTLEQETARYEALASDDATTRFTIYARDAAGDAWRPVGIVALDGIDWRHRTSEFSIFIGDAADRGRGYGGEATRLALDFAFTVLGLHSVMLRVFAYNPAAQRVYERAGFRAFARRTEAQLMDGRYWDVIYMQCLAREFSSPVLGATFVPDAPDADRG